VTARGVRRRSPGVAAVAAALAALAVGPLPASGAPADAPVTVAVEGPLTGPQAATGRDMLRGVRLAVREANARGGVLGRRVVLVAADDRADPSRAVRVARNVARAGAVAVIGPYNSSVGLLNLRTYVRSRVVPIHLTSTDATAGIGVTLQPKNSQIAPVEDRYVRLTGATRVAMLVDPSAFTRGMADRLQARLTRRGIAVTRVPIVAGRRGYGREVAAALTPAPDLVYVSTYFPEGARIARALAAAPAPRAGCLMGLGNVDAGFVSRAGLAASRACRLAGVPAAGLLPAAAAYTRRYRRSFGREPGVWGAFAYDSAHVLFAAMRRTRSTAFGPLLRELRHTAGAVGATGRITVDPRTGNRRNVPVSVLRVDRRGRFVPDASLRPSPPRRPADAAALGTRLVNGFWTALATGNHRALAALLSPAFIIQRADGSTAGRGVYLENLATIRSFAVSNLVARYASGTLVVRYDVSTDQTIGGVGFGQGLQPRLSTFTWSGTRWRMTSHANFNRPG
jgi:branched-chain amino acid transport system substrate-binding protein